LVPPLIWAKPYSPVEVTSTVLDPVLSVPVTIPVAALVQSVHETTSATATDAKTRRINEDTIYRTIVLVSRICVP